MACWKALQAGVSYNLSIYPVRLGQKEQLQKRDGFAVSYYEMQFGLQQDIRDFECKGH